MANSKTALTLVGDGLTALVNDALSEKIRAARVALRTDTEERAQVAQKAVKAAKNEKELFKARIELFEAEGALAVLPPLEKETPEQEAKLALSPSQPEPDLPLDQDFEALCEGEKKVLRRWLHGKYKCISLPGLINAYAKRTGRNPTKDQIKDYIVKENGEGYTENTIITNLSSYGTSPERKKAEKRNRQGKHTGPEINFT